MKKLNEIFADEMYQIELGDDKIAPLTFKRYLWMMNERKIKLFALEEIEALLWLADRARVLDDE